MKKTASPSWVRLWRSEKDRLFNGKLTIENGKFKALTASCRAGARLSLIFLRYYCAWVYALLLSPFALMPRGHILSYVKKVTSSSSQPIVRRLQLALLGEPCTGAVDQITDLDSTAKGTNKGLCPLFIPKGLCSAVKCAPNPPDHVSFPLNVSNVIFL